MGMGASPPRPAGAALGVVLMAAAWGPRAVQGSSAAINCFFKVDDCDSRDPFMECSEVEVEECPDIEYEGALSEPPAPDRLRHAP